MTAGETRSVLFVGAFPRPAALERFVSGDLAGRLAGLGWRVRVTARHPGRLIRFGQLLTETWRYGRQSDVACVDVFSGSAFLWCEAACYLLRRARRPYVLTLHGGNLPAFSQRNAARVKKLLGSAMAVTCPSSYLATEMRPYHPSLILIPNGVDLTRYSFRLRPPPLSKLIWLRAFHQIYNPSMAVEVLAKLDQSRGMRLTMIGPDKDGSLHKTQETARKLGVLGAVSFGGAIPKESVPETLSAADIFLNTTNFDNTPVSVIEALACGLPVVSTNVGGLSYLLRHEETGLLVPPSDVVAMTGAVNRLFSTPSLAEKLSVNGRRQAELYDWSVVLPAWNKLLRSKCGPAG